MPRIETTTNRRIFRKPSSLEIIPYVYDTDMNDYVLGNDVYDLSAIIGDTIKLEPGDGNSERKENEFTSKPLIENITSGARTFTADILDLQDKVLALLFGARISANNVITAFEADSKPMYALIRVKFKKNNVPSIILPKVLLNNKFILEQLSSGYSKGVITGTCFATDVAAIENNQLVAMTSLYDDETLYVVKSDVVIANNDIEIAVAHDYDETRLGIAMSVVDFSGEQEPQLIDCVVNSSQYSVIV